MAEDRQLYLDAAKEIEGGTRDAALWAKAMALSSGDEVKAKYKYINMRVESLRAEQENKAGHRKDHDTLREKYGKRIEVALGNDEGIVYELQRLDLYASRGLNGLWELQGKNYLKYFDSDHEFYEFARRILLASVERSAQFDVNAYLPEENWQFRTSRRLIDRVLGGEYGLVKMFWLFGCLGSIIFGSIAYFLSSPGALLALLVVYIAYFLVVNSGIHYAADKYRGYRRWAKLAKLSTVLIWVALLLAATYLLGILKII